MATHRCKSCKKYTSDIDSPPCAAECTEVDYEKVATIHHVFRDDAKKLKMTCTDGPPPASAGDLTASSVSATCPRCIAALFPQKEEALEE